LVKTLDATKIDDYTTHSDLYKKCLHINIKEHVQQNISILVAKTSTAYVRELTCFITMVNRVPAVGLVGGAHIYRCTAASASRSVSLLTC